MLIILHRNILDESSDIEVEQHCDGDDELTDTASESDTPTRSQQPPPPPPQRPPPVTFSHTTTPSFKRTYSGGRGQAEIRTPTAQYNPTTTQ